MSLHERKSIDSRFRFAGFDYKKIDNDPLEIVVGKLMRKSSSQAKSMKKIISNFSKVVANKRLKTETNSTKIVKE